MERWCHLSYCLNLKTDMGIWTRAVVGPQKEERKALRGICLMSNQKHLVPVPFSHSDWSVPIFKRISPSLWSWLKNLDRLMEGSLVQNQTTLPGSHRQLPFCPVPLACLMSWIWGLALFLPLSLSLHLNSLPGTHRPSKIGSVTPLLSEVPKAFCLNL